MKLTACFIVLMLGLCQGTTTSAPTKCVSDSECPSNECCYLQQDLITGTSSSQGVCEKYTKDGEYCNVIAKQTGHCGCVSGSACKFVPYDAAKVQETGQYGTYACARS